MKTIVELRGMLRDSYELSKKSREEAQKQRDYFDGNQLSPDVLAVLQSRGQPVTWENIYQKTANKILGYKMTMKQELKAKGRQRADMASAILLTDVLRSIPDSTDYYAHKERCDEDLLIAGLSVMEASVNILPESDLLGEFEKEIRGYHVPFDECFIDPYSKAPDYSDGRYFNRVRWLDRDYLYLHFDKKLVDTLLNNQNYTGDFSIDQYRNMANGQDINRDRILVTLTWTREFIEGKSVIRWYVWSNETILAHADSPHVFNRFPYAIRRLYHMHSTGEFYGIFRNIKPIQDRINFMHLRIANMLGSTKLLYEFGAVDDADVFAEEYSKDDAVVGLTDGALSEGRIKEIKHTAEINHLQQLIVDARKQAEQIIGLNDEVLGAAVNRMSGYAIEQRQNAGMVGLQRFLQTSMKQDLDFYNLASGYVQQYFSAEQIVRIIEPNGMDKVVTINEIERDSYGAIKRQNGVPVRVNRIDIGRYDITMSMVNQTRGATGERYTQGVEIMKLMKEFDPSGQIGLAYLPELLSDVEAAGADKIRALIEEMAKAPRDDSAAQMQQQQMMLTLQQMQSKIKELESKSMKNAAQAQKYISESGVSESGVMETMGGMESVLIR
jgi:hypothetical protein